MMSELTRILSAIEHGDTRSAAQLLPLIYGELRKLAAQKLRNEPPGQTLQPTALVHEAYLRLIGDGTPKVWGGRGHFFVAAATAMRRILIERARRRRRRIHGGEHRRRELHSDIAAPGGESDEDLLALDAALSRLAQQDAEKATLVELRYYAGLTVDETAAVLGVSPRTVDRHWTYARAWLCREMAGRTPDGNTEGSPGVERDISSH
jgi:RNA polymerase sigma factor (TIGR02999 family)